METGNGRCRVAIERVTPELDGGLFPIKRIQGESLTIQADLLTDGQDKISGRLLYRREEVAVWQELPMKALGNDRWEATFFLEAIGRYRYTVEAWIDPLASWLEQLKKRVESNQWEPLDLAIGAELLDQAAKGQGRAPTGHRQEADRQRLLDSALQLRAGSMSAAELRALLNDGLWKELLESGWPRHWATRYSLELEVIVDRKKAGFSSWYECFPRSTAREVGAHGTLADVEAFLPYVASMGFDVLYLPPIHPIGYSLRKGKNNTVKATDQEVGSPWAIGSAEGGHKAIHPKLGSFKEFHSLLQAAERLGIEVALDIALQCSPDHPYVKEHPEWFRKRPDGTIQYAENPPKKYQDIYPFDFTTDDWQELWRELKSIFDFWIDKGVRLFRVDNPHTKPFPFWEWCIGEIKKRRPDVLFLAEAFTRPKIMYRLAKIGFSQSYTYFTWRNSKQELTQYLTELNRVPLKEYFRPNFWPNTPDILSEYLQLGGRAAFIVRLLLAATLSPNYGIYGPPFEHGWHKPLEIGSEEYLDSEKYQIHHHELNKAESLSSLIAQLNRIRNEQPALQSYRGLMFHPVDNEELICYTKSVDDRSPLLMVVVNLDPHHPQGGWITLPLESLSIDPNRPYQLHDLLSDVRYRWHGPRNYLEIDPSSTPGYLFQLRRHSRTERDFDYFM